MREGGGGHFSLGFAALVPRMGDLGGSRAAEGEGLGQLVGFSGSWPVGAQCVPRGAHPTVQPCPLAAGTGATRGNE